MKLGNFDGQINHSKFKFRLDGVFSKAACSGSHDTFKFSEVGGNTSQIVRD